MYINKILLLQSPHATSVFCRDIMSIYRERDISVVVGPTLGGAILAFEVARQLGVMAAFAEPRAGGGRVFRDVAIFNPGDHVLVVDDVLTTGKSIHDTAGALPAYVGEVSICVLIDRSGGQQTWPGFRAMTTVHHETWNAETCPLCLAGVAIDLRYMEPKGKKRR